MSKPVFWIVAILGFIAMVALLYLAYHGIGYPFWMHLLFSMAGGYIYGYFASRIYFDLVE